MNHHYRDNMPPWSRRVDSCGQSHRRREKEVRSRSSEYIGALIFNLAFLWIVNNIQDWHTGFIKDNFTVVLWILNLNIIIRIAGNIAMLLSGLPAIRNFSLIIIESAGFVTQIVLFYIYPFDFSDFHGLFWLDWFIPVILVIGMVVSALKVMSNLWKLIFWRS